MVPHPWVALVLKSRVTLLGTLLLLMEVKGTLNRLVTAVSILLLEIVPLLMS